MERPLLLPRKQLRGPRLVRLRRLQVQVLLTRRYSHNAFHIYLFICSRYIQTGAPAPKRPRTSRKGAEGKTTIDHDATSQSKNGNVEAASGSANNHVTPSPATTLTAPTAFVKPNPPVKKVETKKSTKLEPYSPKRALDLFNEFADSDDPDVIGPEGFESICQKANLAMDGALPLIFAWQFEAKEMAKISKGEWEAGTAALRVSSIPALALVISELDDLLMQNKPPAKPAAAKELDYDRTRYNMYSHNIKSGFQKLYQFSFNLVKPEASKNIDMETSVAFWSVLLAPKFPLMKEVIEFIVEKNSYKATNKDLWSMMLEFCETVTPNLDNYEADGAWPTLLDDFVAWKQAKSGAS
ncbi:Cullin binding-domain-containing protein [Panaeolus papilionaceus]|nr:Cullin binding-domain-containing protein [Panaeolus papilionaceus]